MSNELSVTSFSTVGDIVEDDKVEIVELRECDLKDQVAAGGLQPLHNVGSGGVEDELAGLDQGTTDHRAYGCCPHRVADSDEIGPDLDSVARGHCLDARRVAPLTRALRASFRPDVRTDRHTRQASRRG